MYILYSLFLTAAFLLMLPFFLLRREKYLPGFRQRLGELPEFRPDARAVIWLHCVSVGEANAARPIVEGIRRDFPDFRLIVSTTTKTGQDLAREIFADSAEVVFYFPFDWRFSVRRALRRFKPNVVLLMETELWFNFIREAGRSGAFVTIVNGRLSERSARRYRIIGKFVRRVLRRVDLALMQNSEDARRLIGLGIRPGKVKVTGNIKFDQPSAESRLTEELRERFALTSANPLIVAASTHSPEERIVLDAFRSVREGSLGSVPRLLIAPRHPGRFAEVERLIRQSGFGFASRSSAPVPSDSTADVILLDSIGELRTVYPLADIVFVGGSLIPHGGQSILEPAAAGRAIVTGAHTENFSAVVGEFLRNDALIQLAPLSDAEAEEALRHAFARLLGDPAERNRLGSNAARVMAANRGAAAETLRCLSTFLKVHEMRIRF